MDCPKKGDAEAVAVAGLPDDPLVEILSRVPVKSLCRCKCVSKAWRDLIMDPLNRKKLPQTLEGFFFIVDCFVHNSDSDDIDGKDIVSDAGDGDRDNLRHRVCVDFIDMFARSPRLVDDCFPFLTELPGIESIFLLDCCNGLLFFVCGQRSGESLSSSYIVSNPATKQWVTVPGPDREWLFSNIHLVFDPAASSHFHLVEMTAKFMIAVRVYSSNSGVWSPVGMDRGDLHNADGFRHVYVNANGMLYVVLYGEMTQIQIVEMDVEGNTRKIIPVPVQEGEDNEFIRLHCHYVGQSQGRLHLIYNADLVMDCCDPEYDEIPPENSHALFIWVLEDYGTEEWVLKDTVSSLKLFGSICPGTTNDFKVVAIHPDHNLVFFIQYYKDELISYNMDSKEVCRLCTLDPGYVPIFPYVPCFSELPELENKH